MKTILVTNQTDCWDFANEFTEVVDALDYLTNEHYAKQSSLRIVNLCQSYDYQSTGYYVSLLAQARGHKVIPSVLSIRDLNSPTLSATLFDSITDDIQVLFSPIKSDNFQLSVYFGKNMANRYSKLCSQIYRRFPSPLLRLEFIRKKDEWMMKKIKLLTFADIPASHFDFLKTTTQAFFSRKRFLNHTKKPAAFDLAILIDPKEKTPPSNAEAIKKFVEAGEDLGINVDIIQREDSSHILEYDGLFIRETTSVNHYTYRLSRLASAEGLIVIDDPESILKCANKVYLHEFMKRYKIPTANTVIVHKKNWKEIINKIGFPCILKLPDSAFSLGVKKIDSEEAYAEQAKDFLKISDLIIAQAFTPTDFDWRIGVFNNQFLFACRYYMAKGHWQIYNWQDQEELEGNFDVVALKDVPKVILETALHACQVLGNGLYGVDLKEINGRAYVVEVNDNPNIDAGIEDALAKDEIYRTIMLEFLERFKRVKGISNGNNGTVNGNSMEKLLSNSGLSATNGNKTKA